jgi:hypothetical protein
MMTVNGLSTTTEKGQEQYELFTRKDRGQRKTYIQYDYRHTDGELFSCVKPTLEDCRTDRDMWLCQKRNKEKCRDDDNLLTLEQQAFAYAYHP